MFCVYDVIECIEDVDATHFLLNRNVNEASLYSHFEFFEIPDCEPDTDSDLPRRPAVRNFTRNVAKAMIEALFNKKAPANTKMYKGLLRLAFHRALMEDILKTFEAYGPNPEIKERILTDVVKDCIQMCVHLFSFFFVVFNSQFDLTSFLISFRYKHLSSLRNVEGAKTKNVSDKTMPCLLEILYSG